MERSRGGSAGAFRQLALTNYRELIRDTGGFFLMAVFPFLIMGFSFLMGLSNVGKTYAVGLIMPNDPSQEIQQIVNGLEQQPKLQPTTITAEAARGQLERGNLAAVVWLPHALDGDPIRIVVGPGNLSAGTWLRGLIQKATGGLSAERIHVVDMNGLEAAELQKGMLPFTLLVAFWFLAFYSIGFQTVQIRQRGTLKLLGLTPVSRMTYILAQVPSRLGLALGQLVVIGVLAYLVGFVAADRMLGVLFSAIIGILMIFSFGYLVGGTFKHPEAALVIPTAIMPAVAIGSGFMFCYWPR